MKKILYEIIVIIFSFVLAIAFAWIPMLAWNHGVRVIWPQMPEIGYWTAFWLSVGLTYVKTSIVPFKEKQD